MKKLPIVALVGQTNAGKSSIFNWLIGKKTAIVAKEEGTTRDNVMATVDGQFVVVDTAGLKNPEDDFEASIQEQIQDAVEVADMIVVVVDSTLEPSEKDRRIAKMALKTGKPVRLALNKCDKKEALAVYEFLKLGIKEEWILQISATTGYKMPALRTQIVGGLEELVGHKLGGGKTEEDVLKIALIGRPNVGKSSLFNALSKKQQAIVSSKQGTTRDVNRVRVRYEGRTLEILDTAGLRKPGKREVGIEKFSAVRTLAAIEEADICALLVDATEPHSKLDQSLAGQIVEAGKGIVVVLTKTDLLDNSVKAASTISDKKTENYTELDNILDNMEQDFNFLPYAPVLITSSSTGKNVTKLFELALEIDEARHTTLKTSELNKILNEAIISHPPAGLKNTQPKLKYIVQTDTCPPWFVVHGRDMELLHWSYKRFLDRKIREHFPFVGTPIKFSFRNSSK